MTICTSKQRVSRCFVLVRELTGQVLVANKFRNAGQVCVSANRVYVHRSIHDQFAKIVEQKVRALRIGHGLDKGTTTGSLATQRGVERCVRLVEDAKRKGATVVTGGNRVGEGWHFEPTLLVGAGRDAIVHREEMFAPILSMYAFDSEDEVSPGVCFVTVANTVATMAYPTSSSDWTTTPTLD